MTAILPLHAHKKKPSCISPPPALKVLTECTLQLFRHMFEGEEEEEFEDAEQEEGEGEEDGAYTLASLSIDGDSGHNHGVQHHTVDFIHPICGVKKSRTMQEVPHCM